MTFFVSAQPSADEIMAQMEEAQRLMDEQQQLVNEQLERNIEIIGDTNRAMNNSRGSLGILFVISLILGIASLVAFIWALVNILGADNEATWKILWVIVCLLLGILGVIIYLLVGKKQRVGDKPAAQAPPQQEQTETGVSESQTESEKPAQPESEQPAAEQPASEEVSETKVSDDAQKSEVSDTSEKFCSSCGAKMEAGASFCQGCGAQQG
ncbi:PLDc N-terminal domain-containing protein [Candidatus Woesearchaeota archaeon]|nr:PLDc N-terminal domain-containing protein [Candidatus Woesearchaeota archaeon]